VGIVFVFSISIESELRDKQSIGQGKFVKGSRRKEEGPERRSW